MRFHTYVLMPPLRSLLRLGSAALLTVAGLVSCAEPEATPAQHTRIDTSALGLVVERVYPPGTTATDSLDYYRVRVHDKRAGFRPAGTAPSAAEQELAYYCRFRMRDDLYYVAGADSVGVAVAYPELDYGLSPYETLLVGLPTHPTTAPRLKLAPGLFTEALDVTPPAQL